MLVDANILLYSVDASSPFHDRANDWMFSSMNGDRRIGLPWISLLAFLRIATNPRASERPLNADEAWEHIDGWLDAPAAWVPEPGHGFRSILHDLMTRLDVRANLVTDAYLAALCIEHGLTIVSADSDFARFPDVTWLNPIND